MKIQNQLHRQTLGARALRTCLVPLGVAAVFVGSASAQIGFGYHQGISSMDPVAGSVLADFDGDGDRDLAFTSHDPTLGWGRITIRRNDDGYFAAASETFPAQSSGPEGLAAADFNRDGVMDLAVTLKNANGVQFVRGLGRYNYFALGGIVDTGGLEPRQISAADMDGDGDPDLVVSNRASSQVSVLRNDGGGLTLVGAFAMGNEAEDHALGDFDGDGDLDVAVVSRGTGEVAVLMNSGAGSLGAPSFLDVPGATSLQGLAAADIDNDGDIDLVCGAGDGSSIAQNFVAVFSNDGAGAFSGPFSVATEGLGTGDVFAADLDGDGDFDVVAVNEGSRTFAVLENIGGVLTVPGGNLEDLHGVPSEIIGYDIDENGSTDLAVTVSQSSGVYVHHNQASFAVGNNYCTANASSTGLPAHISASGSTWIPANDFRLECTQMPQYAWAYFLTSTTQGFTANPGGSEGNLCLGGEIGRYSKNVRNSGSAGSIALLVDLDALPTPTGPMAGTAGQSWNFQCWFRDLNAVGTTSNFSDAVTVTLR